MDAFTFRRSAFSPQLLVFSPGPLPAGPSPSYPPGCLARERAGCCRAGEGGRRGTEAGVAAGLSAAFAAVCVCVRGACPCLCLRVMKTSLLTQGRASLSSSALALCVSLAHVLLLLLLFLSQIAPVAHKGEAGLWKKGCCCCCSHSCCKGLPFRRPLPEQNF